MMSLNPPNRAAAFVTLHSVVATAAGTSLENRATAAEKDPFRAKVDKETVHLFLLLRIIGPGFGMNGARVTAALEKIRRNEMRITPIGRSSFPPVAIGAGFPFGQYGSPACPE